MVKKRETQQTEVAAEVSNTETVKKTTKRQKKTQESVSPVEVAVVESVVEQSTTEQQPEVSSEETKPETSRQVSVESVESSFNMLLSSLSTLATAAPKGELSKGLKTLLKQCKNLQKDVRRVVKKKKRTPRSGTGNQTGGLMKPVAISNELADFLGVERGSEMSRTEVTRKMSPLLQTMQNPENKRVLKPNKELTKLLKYNNKEHGDLYYYTVQKLIQPHFK